MFISSDMLLRNLNQLTKGGIRSHQRMTKRNDQKKKGDKTTKATLGTQEKGQRQTKQNKHTNKTQKTIKMRNTDLTKTRR
jgi:hypothetical protein